MGLVCQVVGVIMAFGSLGGFLFDRNNALGGALFLIFGIALGGWAENLSDMVDLKKRVSELEAGNSTEAAT
jgi:hypothetical protein